MRPIDADELKKCAIPCEIHNGALTELCVPLYQIDNAPTVKSFTLEDIEEQYRKGLEKGLSEWETERPQGEWVKMSDRYGKYFACNNCGYDREKGITNFCPNCGAEMVGGES